MQIGIFEVYMTEYGVAPGQRGVCGGDQRRVGVAACIRAANGPRQLVVDRQKYAACTIHGSAQVLISFLSGAMGPAVV
jgi:hypothetical protein